MAPKKQPDHKEIEKNIGLSVYKLVAGVKPADSAELGKIVAGLVSASLKASVAGKQTNEQITDLQAKALKALARKLVRKVESL